MTVSGTVKKLNIYLTSQRGMHYNYIKFQVN